MSKTDDEVYETIKDYPDSALESIVRYNGARVAGMTSVQRREFGHEQMLDAAKRILAERRRAS